MPSNQEQDIAKLRALNLTPKQIARKLGLPVAEVTAVIRRQAQQSVSASTEPGGLAPVAECWVNAKVAEQFFGPQSAIRADSDQGQEDLQDEADLGSGLSIVTVTRKMGYNRFVVCTYLVDYWCLGVKDTSGPRKLNGQGYTQLLKHIYDMFDEEPQRITLEQAQAIVMSAVEYAAKLGFQPHRDFEQSRAHLGNWDGQQRIKCGRDGKPFYFCGPYDNSAKILKTLTENVGEGKFDYVASIPE